MKETVSIMCPRCGKFLLKVAKDDVRIHKIGCRKCRKWIWKSADNKFCEIKDIPPRETSSGTMFYF